MVGNLLILHRAMSAAMLLVFAATLGTPVLTSAQTPTPPSPASDGLSGLVVDAESGVPLSDATVTIEACCPGHLSAGSGEGSSFLRSTWTTLTDREGTYHFVRVAVGDYRLHVQRLGYRSATIEVAFRGSVESHLSVGLQVEPIALQPVEVSATAHAGNVYGRMVDGDTEDQHRLAAERLRQRLYLASDVRTITHADVVEGITLGETDLFRALQRLPGVSTRDEYSAELWTRGAPWDQTRIYFDGLPLFNPLHAMGLFSGINSDAIGAAFLHPGVQPVSLGGGAAGSLDIRSRKGGTNGGLSGVGELSLASGRLALDGTMRKGRHTWMVAGRRSYLDWLTRIAEPLIDEDNLHLPYNFSDLTSRYDYRIGEESTLELSVLQQSNRVYGDLPDVLHGTSASWGGGAARATVEIPVRKLRMRHTLGVSLFASLVRRREADPRLDSLYNAPRALDANNEVVYYTLKGDIQPRGSSSGPGWSAGYQLVGQYVRLFGPRPGLDSRLEKPRHLMDRELYREDHRGYGALWGERRWKPTPALTIDTGLRLEAGPAVRNGGRFRWAPRLSARYQVDPGLSVSAAAGRAYQYTQAILPAGLDAIEGFRTEYLWVLAGDSTPVLRADLATLGAEAWIGGEWLGSVTGYLRHSTGVAIPSPVPGSALDRPLFVASESRARGVEVSARKLAGRWTASVSYTYGVSEAMAEGLRFLAPADQRHALDATAMARLGRGWQLGAAYTAASGTPYTRTSAGRPVCETSSRCTWEDEPWLGEPNARRMGWYRSLVV